MKYIYTIFIVIMLVACRTKEDGHMFLSSTEVAPEMDPISYLTWTESDAGLRAKKQIGEITFQLQYMPSDYMVLKNNIDSLSTLNEEKEQQQTKGYEKLQFYKLRISIDGFNEEIMKYNMSKNDYEERVKYYAFNMQHDLKLIDGADTLPCLLFNFERTFNVSPHSDFQCAFSATDDLQNKTLVFDDKYLGVGKTMLTIPGEKLKLTPKIKYNL